MQEDFKYIPAFNGFERQGKFPLDKSTIFNSLEEAAQYAEDGRWNNSSAYVGQLISVIDKDHNKTTVFTISPDWKLEGLTSTISTDTSTYVEFNAKAVDTGAVRIVLEKGSFLKSITVQIIQPFIYPKQEGELYVNSFIVGGDDVSDPNREKKYLGENEMLCYEAGDYTVFFNQIIEKQTSVVLYTIAGVPVPTQGLGILKIN